jgi:hypothetical protein
VNRDSATSREAILPNRVGNPVCIGAEQGSGTLLCWVPKVPNRSIYQIPKTHASINLQIPKNRLHPSRKFRCGVSHEETGGMKPNPQIRIALDSCRIIVTGINGTKKSATDGLPAGVLYG